MILKEIEPYLFLLELVLLTTTVALLLMSRKEWKRREQLLKLLTTAMRSLSREEYFNQVTEGLKKAKSIHAVVTGTRPTQNSQRYVDNILEIMCKNKDAEYKFLLPESPEKLEMGYQYTKCGAEVRLHGGLVIYDLRFMLIDKKYALLGLPEVVGENQPTRRGLTIGSENLTKILMDYFDDFWNKADTYETYTTNFISKMVEKNPGVSNETIAKQLNLDIKEVDRIVGNRSTDSK